MPIGVVLGMGETPKMLADVLAKDSCGPGSAGERGGAKPPR